MVSAGVVDLDDRGASMSKRPHGPGSARRGQPPSAHEVVAKANALAAGSRQLARKRGDVYYHVK